MNRCERRFKPHAKPSLSVRAERAARSNQRRTHVPISEEDDDSGDESEITIRFAAVRGRRFQSLCARAGAARHADCRYAGRSRSPWSVVASGYRTGAGPGRCLRSTRKRDARIAASSCIDLGRVGRRTGIRPPSCQPGGCSPQSPTESARSARSGPADRSSSVARSAA
jgi:hypothetical protein